MAISRLTGQDATGTASTTSVSATYASTPTLGNLLIAIVGDSDGNNGTIPTLTGWINVVNIQGGSGTNLNMKYRIATGAESTTVTATNANAGFMTIAIYEYTGFTGTPTLDKSASAGSSISATSSTGTTATTTDGNELLFVAAFASGTSTSFTSWSNSFNTRNDIPGPILTNRTATGDQIVSATNAYVSTATFGTLQNSIAAGIFTFKSPNTKGFFSLMVP